MEEQKVAEELIGQSEIIARAIMDTVPAYVFVSQNREGTQMIGNKATNVLLGLPTSAKRLGCYS